MINIDLSITNPWSSRWHSGKCWSGDITKNKFWELQAMKTNDIISLNFLITTRRDHSGMEFSIGFIGFKISFNIYDIRHWDSERRRYVIYDNEGNRV